MLKVSGMVIMVRKAGMATSGSCQSISPTTDTIMLPTMISAGAVAAAGMTPTTGAMKSASDEEQSGDDRGDAGAPSGRHAGRAFDIAHHGRSAGEGADDRGHRVGEQDAVDARNLAHLVEQVRLLADRHQGADVVEQIDEQEDENNLHEADAQRARDIQLAGGSGQIAQAVGLRRPFGDAGEQSRRCVVARMPISMAARTRQASSAAISSSPKSASAVLLSVQIAQGHRGGGMGTMMPELRKPMKAMKSPTPAATAA